MERENRIELRSEKVRNIIGTPPPAVILWGNAVILSLLFIAFAVAWCVDLPYKVNFETAAVFLPNNDGEGYFARVDMPYGYADKGVLFVTLATEIPYDYKSSNIRAVVETVMKEEHITTNGMMQEVVLRICDETGKIRPELFECNVPVKCSITLHCKAMSLFERAGVNR